MSDVATSARGALFLDRDGTVIIDEHYLGDATRVRLLPGAARAIVLANDSEVPVMIITNQSGIGRGYITEQQYRSVSSELNRQLTQHGAAITATYYCPHAPSSVAACACRKPGTGMYRQAAQDHHIDLTRSAYIGDKWRDVEPALLLNGLGILIPTAITPQSDVDRALLTAHTAADIGQAVDKALAWMRAQE